MPMGDGLRRTNRRKLFKFISNSFQSRRWAPLSFDDFTWLQPKPRDRRSPPLVGVHALYVGLDYEKIYDTCDNHGITVIALRRADY